MRASYTVRGAASGVERGAEDEGAGDGEEEASGPHESSRDPEEDLNLAPVASYMDMVKILPCIALAKKPEALANLELLLHECE